VLDREFYFDPEDPNRNTNTMITMKSYNPYTTRVRKYGYMFQEFSTTVDSIQKMKIMLAADINVVASQAVAHAYTGISVDGVTNTITISEDHTMQEVYDYCEDWASLTANMGYNEPFVTTDGQNFTSTYDLVLDGCDLTGSATISMVVNSVTYLNGATSTVTIVADDGTHTNIKLTNIVSGSRVLLYNTDTDTVLFNDEVTTELTFPITWTADQNIEITVTEQDGVTAHEFWQQNATLTASGINLQVSQIDDKYYNELAIDGSTITEFQIVDDTLLLLVNDPDTRSKPQRAYAFAVYWSTTETGILDRKMYVAQNSLVETQLLNDILIYNASTNPVTFTDGYFVDKDGSYYPEDIYDTTSTPMFVAYGGAIGLPYTSNPQSPDILVAYTRGDD
jgi:hypothetical protein